MTLSDARSILFLVKLNA